MKLDQLSKAIPESQVLYLNTQEPNEGGLELGKILLILRKNSLKVAVYTTIIALLAALRAYLQPPSYSSSFQILTRATTGEQEVVSSVDSSITGNTQEKSVEDAITTRIAILKSPRLLNPVINRLSQRYPGRFKSEIAEELNRNLRIEAVEPNILKVSFSGGDPLIVDNSLNLLQSTYLNYSLEEQQKYIRQAVRFVDKQLPALNAKVTDLQARLQVFRKQNNLIEPDKRGEALSTQLEELSKRRLENQAQLEEKRLLLERVENELADQEIKINSSSVLAENPRYQKILDQLQEVDNQIALGLSKYNDSYPQLQILREQRQDLLPLLRQEALRIKQQLVSQIKEQENREQALQNSSTTIEQQIKTQAVVLREYTDIQRELQIATTNLNQFLTKREALRIDAAQKQVPWEILAAAEAAQPTQAGMKQTIAIGGLLGLIIGVSAVLLQERMSNSLYSLKELQAFSGVPLLGVLPLNRQLLKHRPKQLVLASGPEEQKPNKILDSFYECFRSIYIAVDILKPSDSGRVIVVTSPMPESGKTITALYLARAAAAMGKRVLLVDANLRNPELHTHLGMEATPGLTDLIQVRWQFKVKQVWEKNLYVLPCGTISPQSAHALTSVTMENFVRESQKIFDLVIFDSSYLLNIADVYFHSSYKAEVILVGKVNQLKRQQLEHALQILKQANLSVIGMIAS